MFLSMPSVLFYLTITEFPSSPPLSLSPSLSLSLPFSLSLSLSLSLSSFLVSNQDLTHSIATSTAKAVR